MLAAIKHGLHNLVNFQGRDARQAFWYYVLFVYIISVAITMVVVIPLVIQAIAAGVQAGIAASQSSDPVAAQMQVQGTVMHEMAGMMSNMMIVSTITNLLMMAALAASFVRRLHDSDLSGLWALLPGAIQVVNVVLAPALMRRMMDNMSQMEMGDPTAPMRAMQGSMGAASLLGWVAIIAIIVLGVRKSSPGPNRFGEVPFTA
jgi:uncharacterized membrane protein YhaH (DUF805 family)